MDPDSDDQQARDWEKLYDKLLTFITRFGSEDIDQSADCWVLEDNWGPLQHKVFVRNLDLLREGVIRGMQALLTDFPEWEIVIAVSVVAGKDWPDMGLIVRKHEIIDGLQRQYFPIEYQDIRYSGARLPAEPRP